MGDIFNVTQFDGFICEQAQRPCGLGFEVAEDIEGGYGTWNVVVHPFENSCNSIELPTTKEGFVEAAAKLGIEWDIDEVADLDDIY